MTARKILVVEDDMLQQVALVRILSRAGYEVSAAGDAVAAVSIAVRERPDLVLLDLGLPAGGGTVVLERLRNLPATSTAQVVVVTGGMVNYAEQKSLENLGCEAILTKPIAAELLLESVEAVLDPQASRRSDNVPPDG